MLGNNDYIVVVLLCSLICVSTVVLFLEWRIWIVNCSSSVIYTAAAAAVVVVVVVIVVVVSQANRDSQTKKIIEESMNERSKVSNE
jgi:hypothetical protein